METDHSLVRMCPLLLYTSMQSSIALDGVQYLGYAQGRSLLTIYVGYRYRLLLE